MSVVHNDYHSRREAQERAQAEKAADESTRRLHLDLAECHAERAGAGTPQTA